MRFRATAAMAAMLLCAASLGSAQTATPGVQHMVGYGAGGPSCGKWLAERKGTNWYTMGQWLLGWLTAAGYYNVRGGLRETDSDAATAWVDNYCREHPLDNLVVAPGHLVDELSKPQ